MADYFIWALPESQVSITGGQTLDGITQGDGSHLVGETLTLAPGPLTKLEFSDDDQNFDDNDGDQRLDGGQTFDGVSYGDNTQVEAEYQLTLRDNDTGETYQVVAVNVVNSSPAYGTAEGLAFVDRLPPTDAALEVISAGEGPGSLGQTAIHESRFATCFTSGAVVETDRGPVIIDDLRPGDRALNIDGDPVAIRWIGQRHVGQERLAATPNLRPVRITAGALGGGLPRRDLLVSRQHRMLVRSKIAERMLGVTEVLIPAIRLTELPGILIDTDIRQLTYFHLLFDRHQIIQVEGAPTESLFTGPGALDAIGPDARAEIMTLFPELADMNHAPEPARCIPPGRLQKRLIGRHLKNKKHLLDLSVTGPKGSAANPVRSPDKRDRAPVSRGRPLQPMP